MADKELNQLQQTLWLQVQPSLQDEALRVPQAGGSTSSTGLMPPPGDFVLFLQALQPHLVV